MYCGQCGEYLDDIIRSDEYDSQSHWVGDGWNRAVHFANTLWALDRFEKTGKGVQHCQILGRRCEAEGCAGFMKPAFVSGESRYMTKHRKSDAGLRAFQRKVGAVYTDGCVPPELDYEALEEEWDKMPFDWGSKTIAKYV